MGASLWKSIWRVFCKSLELDSKEERIGLGIEAAPDERHALAEALAVKGAATDGGAEILHGVVAGLDGRGSVQGGDPAQSGQDV